MTAILAGLACGAAQTVPAALFPIDTVGGQNSYSANVIRRYSLGGSRMASVTSTGIGTTTPSRTLSQITVPGTVIDGHTDLWKLQSNNTTADANATGIVQITLDQVYEINKFVQQFYGNYAPDDTEIRVSSTGFSGMTTVVPRATIGANTTATVTSTFNAVAAKYIELQMWGVRSGNAGFAMFSELQAYADSALNAPLDSLNGYNIIALKNPTISTSEPGNPIPSKWSGGASTIANAVNLNMNQTSSWLLGANSAGTAGYGDAAAVVDLGSLYRISAVTLDFYYGHSWPAGSKLEISGDGSTYFQLSGAGSLGAGDYTTAALAEGQKNARYIRLTDFNSAWSGSILLEMEVFGNPIPEPASLALLAFGAGLACWRRRR